MFHVLGTTGLDMLTTTSIADIPLALGGATAGSTVEDLMDNADSEAAALPASSRELLSTGAQAWVCICHKQASSTLCSISCGQRVFQTIMGVSEFFLQHNIIYPQDESEFYFLNAAIAV